MPLLAMGLWFLAIILTLPFLAVLARPVSLIAISAQRPVTSPEDTWRALSMAAVVGLFLAVCGVYIWTHP